MCYGLIIDYIRLIPGLETGSRVQVVYVTNDEIMLVAVASYNGLGTRPTHNQQAHGHIGEKEAENHQKEQY